MAYGTDGGADRRAAAEGERRTAPFFPPRGDVAVALVVLAVAAILYAVTLTIEEAPRSLARGMQPREFPQLVLGTIAVLAVILLVNAKPPRRTRAAAPGSRLTVALTALACVAAVVVFERVGLIVTIVLFAAGLPLLWGERRLGLVAAYAVLLPAAIWGVFAGVLDVYFPSAVLDFFVR